VAFFVRAHESLFLRHLFFFLNEELHFLLARTVFVESNVEVKAFELLVQLADLAPRKRLEVE